jgi:low temperature requirement protein LtrA
MFYAIADELVAGHGEFTTAAAIASIVGGPLVYLIGVLLFKRSTRGRFDAAHVAGIVALAAVAPVASLVSRLTLVITTAVVLVIVAVWESLAGRATTQV